LSQNVHLTSLQNSRLKDLLRLRDEKHTREGEGLMFVEGLSEITLALTSGWQPRMLLTAPDLATEDISPGGAELVTASTAVFRKLSSREHPDGWIAVFPIPRTALEDLAPGGSPLIIVAESLEKPGNLGAILRTADAARVDAVLVCDPRVDPWNPNVVRASRGTVFTVPVVVTQNAPALEWIRSRKLRLLAAAPSASAIYTDIDMRGPIAFALGTEDQGLTRFWLSNADAQVKIPLLGTVNSLNVSVAAALLTFEAIRQRSGPTSAAIT